MIASYARCAVRRETRGCQPEKPSWPSRGMCMTPLMLRKTRLRQYLQSNNGGFFFFFFLPRSPVVSHAMSNLDFSTMEDWLTAFMVWILALFVLLLCFGIFSLVRKNSFLLEKLVIGSITYKPLQKKPRPLVSSWTSFWVVSFYNATFTIKVWV